jgi:energy-coupling factor transport system ATP-binding protein
MTVTSAVSGAAIVRHSDDTVRLLACAMSASVTTARDTDSRGGELLGRRGEVVLLLGPSGAGKSTLALALNGLIPHAVPAALGTVQVDGLDTARPRSPCSRTHVGMVFQDPDAQLVTGTLLDEVAFGPENLRMPVDDVLARARKPCAGSACGSGGTRTPTD